MARKYSSEYKNLQPYVIEDVRKVVNAVGAAGSTGSGSMEVHALNGAYHSGELAQTQASWAATKVELSNHAALPDVHHAKLHAITDAANHSATGSQYQIVGLTAVNTLGLLTPKSSPAANEIVKTDGASMVTLVDVTVTSDLFMSGYLDFGTNTMYEDASYLQVAGSKAVKFSQNIGNANWTVYNAGGAQFGGNVDIISGGDLTVAGSGAYAGNQVLFADSSGGNVGIMRVPDSQFALDIAGPCRADWFIGPHAIQLKNVLMLCHFDGRAPYETNYSGEPNGHMGQVATVGGGVIYRPGKFYKAAQFAAAGGNSVTNPSFETGTTGWAASGGSSIQQITTSGYVGTCCMRLYGATNGFTNTSVTASTSANTTYVMSAYVRGTGKFRLRIYDNVAGYRTSSEYTATTEWTRYSLSATFGAGSTDRQIGFLSTNGVEIFVDAVQLESSSVLSPYMDGSLGDGHYWTGAAHASVSARNAASMVFATSGNINPAKGTIMAWVNTSSVTSAAQTVLRINGASAGYIILRLDSTNKPQAYAGTGFATAGSAVTAGAWTHLAMTWDGTNVYLYVNGAYAASAASSGFSGIGVPMYVGCTGASEYFNGWIDDLVILDRTMTVNADNSCDEIRTVYESNAPVFAESSTFSFRPTPKGLIWADDEGLWMRDSAGNPVLGVYGGEAATKSWAGFTLAAGDIVFGRNAVGSSAIWWDQSAGKFGFYGAGSGTPQVEIATDGKLTAGAGKVKLDSTGFHAFNASSVATIDINADGIYLGDGGARTTIGSWTSGNRIRAYNVGEIYEASPETYLDDSSISRTLYPLVIRGIRQGNDAALIELAAVQSSDGTGAKIIIGEGFRLKGYYGSPYSTNRVVHAIATDIILEATNLQLRSLTTSTAAVGTYSGKIRIQIAGTNVYIPYYAS